VKLGLVNDLTIAVEILKQSVSTESDLEIAWIAMDGKEAVERCRENTPDIVLMDLIMPVMNGVEATRQIMEETPCAILVVTASVGQNTSLVFDAMSQGAIDAVNTPSLGADGKIDGQDALIRKIRTIGQLISQTTITTDRTQTTFPTHPEDYQVPPMIAIGASTGGPSALAEVLSGIPGDINATLVIIQHVDKQFAGDLATWLNDRTELTVQLAEEFSRPETGHVYVAGTNDHLVLTSALQFRISADPEACSYRPSVDVFFQSLAKYWPEPGTAVLLTGMGRDGGIGMKQLRDKGWHTIAQDEATSIIFGMPKAAIDLDGAKRILALPNIATGITLSIK